MKLYAMLDAAARRVDRWSKERKACIHYEAPKALKRKKAP